MIKGNLKWLTEQKNMMLDKTLSISRRLQNERKRIAKPYVHTLKKRFPDIDSYKLIQIADSDLQNSNKNYKELTKLLIELKHFNQGPFNELVKLIKQTQP